jgi:hypothetical protein
MNNTNVYKNKYTEVLLLYVYQERLFYQADNGLIFAVPVGIADEKRVPKAVAAADVEPWIGNAVTMLECICREVGRAD